MSATVEHSQQEPTPSQPEQEGRPQQDERVMEMSRWRQVLIRPELGAICGSVLVIVFFFLIARDSGMFASDGILNWATVSAQFMTIAVGACLLMIILGLKK